jgi:hypothetical protein
VLTEAKANEAYAAPYRSQSFADRQHKRQGSTVSEHLRAYRLELFHLRQKEGGADYATDILLEKNA